MKRPLIFHPLLIGLFPIFFLFSHNVGRIHLRGLVPSLCLSLLWIGVVWLISLLLIRHKAKAALIASLFLILFFSFGHLCELAKNLNVGGIQLGRFRFLIPLEGIFFTAAAIGIVKTKIDLAHATRRLNKFGLLLILIPLLPMGKKLLVNEDWLKQTGLTVPVAKQRPASLPDIYYIIPDGYGRQDILEKVYGYDNTPFLEELRRRGFYIADKSRANYPITRYSLTSSLNFAHLDFLQRVKSKKMVTLGMVEGSRIIRFLGQEGYTFIAFRTGSEMTEIQSADIYLSSRKTLSEFESLYLNTTPLPRIIDTIYPHFFKDLLRERFFFTLHHLPDVAKSERPVFAFVHLMITHPPYAFQENGTMAGNGDRDAAEYIRHIQILNKEILKTIDRILAESPQPPIIILQADHGPAFWELLCRPGANLHQSLRISADKHDDLLTTRMSILNAYYLPGIPEGVLYQEITPVNTFRVILDHYFRTGLGLLEDRSFIFNDSLLSPFLEVTKILNDVEAKQG